MKTFIVLQMLLLVVTGCQTAKVQNTNKEQYILEYKRQPPEKERTGFYSKGKDLSVLVEKTVFPERKENEYEYTEQRVTFHIKNHTDKLLILDLQGGDIQTTSSVTSDSNYDNLGNHEPIQKIDYETGLFALHPTTTDDSFPHIWKILRNQESFVSDNPLIKLVCFDNSCALMVFHLKYREAHTSEWFEEYFDIPISTGQNWYYWKKMFTEKYGAEVLRLEL